MSSKQKQDGHELGFIREKAASWSVTIFQTTGSKKINKLYLPPPLIDKKLRYSFERSIIGDWFSLLKLSKVVDSWRLAEGE